MKTSFSTSINIARDYTRKLNYLPTPNAHRVARQIAGDYKKGSRAFSIIGSYGSGKSAFLWAYEQSLKQINPYFDVDLHKASKVGIINIVGEYRSIISVFFEILEIKSRKEDISEIFSELFNRYCDLGRKGKLLVIVVDEFGKFLEYASKNLPERELYFIQQLAEFVNHPDHSFLLLTTIHQNFDAYAFSLINSDKTEWSKVKGRFIEVTFNEPVEQLIYLAAQSLNWEVNQTVQDQSLGESFQLARKSKAFNFLDDFTIETNRKLYPLDLISAYVVAVSSQRYGQNERSLFTFLEASDYTGVQGSMWKRTNPFYNLSCVYDYLVFSFYSFLNSSQNRDFSSWSAIRSSLEIAESLFGLEKGDYQKLIKALGLLSIFASRGAILDKEFLKQYSKVCLGIDNAEVVIEELERNKVIIYQAYNNRYSLFEGTDLDIQAALFDVENRVSEITDVANLLNRYFSLPYVLAKKYSYENGTPRNFEYKISSFPITEVPKGETDGYINLIFNDSLKIEDLLEISKSQEEAVVYGFYTNTKAIKTILFEIQKTKQVLIEQKKANDRVAIKELSNIITHQENLLSHKILNQRYSGEKEVLWVFSGQIQNLKSKREFNQLLSKICFKVYTDTPKFVNELVNKHRISYSIHTAKKNYIKAIVYRSSEKDAGFVENKFPPEKTIYLAIVKQNRLDLNTIEGNNIDPISKRSSFLKLWNASESFLKSCVYSKRSISDFEFILSSRPLKLKQGLIDFWLITYIFMQRSRIAVYNSTGFIPYLTDEVFELIIKNPSDYYIKAFDIDGIKLELFSQYRKFTNTASDVPVSSSSFVETIKPFLTFYRGLSDYAKGTFRLSKEAVKFRTAISMASDPEKAFFEDFPAALGVNLQQTEGIPVDLSYYHERLQNVVAELRDCKENLIKRFESFVIETFIGTKETYPNYARQFQIRFKGVKNHWLLAHQQTFLQRINSRIDDRLAWLNSVAQTLMGKTFDKFTDQDEIIATERFHSIVIELDNLTSLGESNLDPEREDMFKLEISSLIQGVQKKIVRLPKVKQVEVSNMEQRIMKVLTSESGVNLSALSNVLMKIMVSR